MNSPMKAEDAKLGEDGLPCCMDCGLSYGDAGFADLVVPHDVWKRMSPPGHEGGLLCPTCMVRRAVMAGLDEVPAKFTSGPFACSPDALASANALNERLQEFVEEIADSDLSVDPWRDSARALLADMDGSNEAS